jgi:hypothetical protein
MHISSTDGMRDIDNGEDHVRVKIGGSPAEEWKRVLRQAVEDNDEIGLTYCV